MTLTSTFDPNQHFSHHQPPDTFRTAYDYDSSHTSQSALPTTNIPYNCGLDASAFASALALLQQPSHLSASTEEQQHPSAYPDINLQDATPDPPAASVDGQQSYLSPGGTAVPHYNWMYQSGVGSPAVHTTQAAQRARSHQRTPSASTVTSNGPASPYAQSWGHPQIANTDFAFDSPQFAEPANFGTFSKTPFTPENGYLSAGYVPSIASHTGGAHQAMKGFVIDHHNREEFAHSSRPSMSSNGRDSPSTPHSGAGEAATNGQAGLPQNGETRAEKDMFKNDYLLFGDSDYRPANPNVQLFRTESQAFQDELYNPPTTTFTSTPAATKTAGNLLSPHRNLVSERLNTANIARSHSPSSAVSRERSPFRDGSPLAPPGGWRSPAAPAGGVGTAAGMRQQQKEQAEQAELAQHRPQLKREPTKTISPKDALLDYNEQEQQPLFQDSIPPGYKQHTGGATEQWQNNNASFYSQPGTAFGSLTTPSQQFGNFRATSSADGFSGANGMNNFQPLPQSQEPPAQIPNGGSFGSFSFPKMENHAEANPQFPAQLTSMESSASDHAPPGSQDSNSGSIQRPADTRAGTGTYTCTYHGCTQRFDSHANLQKHKRESHRSLHQRDTSGAGTSSGTASTSPRASASPAVEEPLSTEGMTNAAIAARNSQTGPHKCTRTNPSTGKPCNTIFSRPYDLTRHEDTIHNNRKQKVRCPMCREEKTFSRNDALTRHMRVVHPEVETFGKRGKRG